MKKTAIRKLTTAILLSGVMLLCSVPAFAANSANGGVPGDLGRAAEDVGDGIRNGVEDIMGNGTANGDARYGTGTDSVGSGNTAGDTAIGQGGTENSGNNMGSSGMDNNKSGTSGARDNGVSGRTADSGNGDSVVENGSAGRSNASIFFAISSE